MGRKEVEKISKVRVFFTNKYGVKGGYIDTRNPDRWKARIVKNGGRIIKVEEIPKRVRKLDYDLLSGVFKK